MRRREFIALLGSAATSLLSAYAQSATKILRVGHVALSDTEGVWARNDFLDKQLESLGYVSGKNIILTEKFIPHDLRSLKLPSAVSYRTSIFWLSGLPSVRR
jgi:hypothetical protein